MSFTAISYGAAAVVYGFLTLVLVARRETKRRGQRVLAAVAGTAVWGAAVAIVASAAPAEQGLTAIPDALRTLLWSFCLLTALPGGHLSFGLKGILSVAASALAGAVLVVAFVAPARASLLLLVLSIIGCLVAEQILRNAAQEEKRVLRPFLWTMTAVLIYDVFVFAEGVLFGAMNWALYAPRGMLAALAVPFFLLAAKRHPDWEETLFVSREFVFYSATLTGVGVYLIAMATGSLLLPARGQQWGVLLLVAYLAAAVGVLVFILSSSRLKARLRVFINKHFYRNRYDYREEWLRLIRTLSASRELPLEQRSIKALASIVGSGGGQLWLDRSGGAHYEPFAAWEAPYPTREFPASSPLVQFLKEHEWVIDMRQYEADPDHYQNAFRGEDLPSDSLFVPLMREGALFGIVRLESPVTRRELNYEDHDLLKTAGSQVAAFLSHDLARELLAESRQFEAFNKLSAFVMHDLKNLLAQQVLLLDNAKKFRDRPGFLDDVIKTIDSGVQRMRMLLAQLGQRAPLAQLQRVELNKLLLRAVSARSADERVPCSFQSGPPCWVRANPETLGSVITHVIQNAQEATKSGDAVVVTLESCGDGRAVIEVRDSGIGMSEEFMRHKLFKPFESTKGSAGMGIGAYQAREIVRGLGGEFTVRSELGKGTVVTIWLREEKAAPESQRQTASL